ncbi:hypothetical protein ACLMJK_001705 [Lecanora helva]
MTVDHRSNNAIELPADSMNFRSMTMAEFQANTGVFCEPNMTDVNNEDFAWLSLSSSSELVGASVRHNNWTPNEDNAQEIAVETLASDFFMNTPSGGTFNHTDEVSQLCHHCQDITALKKEMADLKSELEATRNIEDHNIEVGSSIPGLERKLQKLKGVVQDTKSRYDAFKIELETVKEAQNDQMNRLRVRMDVFEMALGSLKKDTGGEVSRTTQKQTVDSPGSTRNSDLGLSPQHHNILEVGHFGGPFADGFGKF